MTFVRLLLVALLAAASAVSAADEPTISEIIITSATSQTVSDAMVRSNILSREGNTFSRKQLTEDIRRLYATKQFDDVEASTTSDGNKNVSITFRITPKPHVETVSFQGNDKYGDKKLGKKIELEVGSVLDEKQLAADLRTLYDFYQGKGFNDVVIKQDVERLEQTHTVNVIYTIEEGTRFKTRGVDFVGLNAFKNGRLKRVMRTEVSLLGRILPFGWFDETAFQDDLDRIRQQYRNAGYLDFNIEQVERRYNDGNDKIYLTIHLSEGEPYQVSSVDFVGNTVIDEAELRELTRMTAGELYRGDTEDRDLKVVTAHYNRDGYLESRVIPELSADEASNTLKLTYRIIEGTASTIRNINISGNTVTKDEVIRRELLLHPGDKADSTRIDASQRRLKGLGYFEKADVIPTSTGNDAEKDLNVAVAEKPTGRLMVSAGFSSTDSLVGGLEVAQSNFDIADPWGFRGDGQRFRARAFVGSERNDLILSFTEPWLFDRRLRLDTDLWSRTTSSNREYDQNAHGGSVRITKKLEAPFWRVSTGLRLELLEIEDMDTVEFSAPFRTYEEDDNLASAITLGFTRDSRDQRINPNSGSVFTFENELQTQAIGGYTDAYKLTLGYDYYLPVFKRSVIKFGSEVSSIQHLGGDDVRIFDRLFAGGARSIRGFDEREISPVETGPGLTPAQGSTPIGGQSSWVSTVEYLTPVYQNTVYFATFSDFGNVWPDAFDFNPGEFNVGVGIGLRLRLPIGAINIDYGFPVVREQDHLDSGGQIHFNMGYNF